MLHIKVKIDQTAYCKPNIIKLLEENGYSIQEQINKLEFTNIKTFSSEDT